MQSEAAPSSTAVMHIFPRSFKVSLDGTTIPRINAASEMVGSSLLKNLAGARVFEELMMGNFYSRNSRIDSEGSGSRSSMTCDGMHSEG